MILLPLLFLLSPGFGPASAQQTRPNNMVTVSEGEVALLKCGLSSGQNIDWFHWGKDNGEGEMKEVFMYKEGKYSGSDLKGQSEQFVGRVVFFKDKVASGNASIKIKNTRLEDNGTYSCKIIDPRTSVVHIILNVVGVLKTRENVTGAAPVPYTYHFHFENGRILLQCKAQGVPKPEVEWRNSSGEALTAENKQVQEYKDASGRFHVEVKVNVTRIDHYTCVVTQRSIYHQINFTLTDIAQGQEDPQHIWFDLAVTFIVLFAAVAIAALIGAVCYFYRQRRRSAPLPEQNKEHMNSSSLSEPLNSVLKTHFT